MIEKESKFLQGKAVDPQNVKKGRSLRHITGFYSLYRSANWLNYAQVAEPEFQ